MTPYIETAIKTGKVGMDVMNWWDKNSSGKYRTTANQLMESIGLGGASRTVAGWEQQAIETINNITPGYHGYDGQVGYGDALGVVKDVVVDAVAEIPGWAISANDSAARGIESIWNWMSQKEPAKQQSKQQPPLSIQPSQDEVMHNPHGVLRNNWT